MTQKIMGTYQITSASISASGTFTSAALSIGRGENFSVIVTAVTGTSPDYSITYTAANESGATFIAPASNTICSNQSSTGIWSFTPVPAPWIKIVITNNNASNAVVPTVKFMMQEEV